MAKLKLKKAEPVAQTLEEIRPHIVNSLEETIDRTKPFSIYYSGVETRRYFDTMYSIGIRNFLMSYHYIQSKKIDMSEYAGLGIKFFIDSGAYTFQTNEEYANRTKEEWELQIIEYLAWARENKEYIFAIANLDLEAIFDFETTKEWNEKYFEPFMLETGIPVCFIWHMCDGIDGWEYYTKRYPYTGFSWITSDNSFGFNEAKQLLDIARKNDSLCHGMGMTRTGLLTKLPFYTTDSTTWQAGLQFGEVNYWTGSKMKRLKKEQWKGEYLQAIVDLGCDREGLLNETYEELVKSNVYAFIQAQEYINSKLRPRMYWLNPTAKANDRNDPDIIEKFPTLEWLSGDTNYEGYEDFARDLNINPELPKDDIVDILMVMCVVLFHEEDETTEVLMENLKDYHDYYINRVVSTDEQRIEDLTDFFWNVVEGKEDKFLMEGIRPSTKERDFYIEEEEYENVEVSKEEYEQVLQQVGVPLLPEDSSAPEIDEMDKEIFSNTGFLAIRDEKGRLVKGQKTIKKPKNIYSEKYPKLACSTCYAGQTCPHFKEGYVCAFNKMFKRFDCRDANDVLEAMNGMVNMNMERMQRVAIFEMLHGGMPDQTLTNLIDQNMKLLMNMKSLQHEQQAIMKQVRTINADGSMQETTQINSNGGSAGGVMEALMKNIMNKNDADKKDDLDINDVIEVNPNDIVEVTEL